MKIQHDLRSYGKRKKFVLTRQIESGKLVEVTVTLKSWRAKILRPFGMYAITLRNSILVNGDTLTARQVNHELCHVDQWHRYGVFGFLCRYLWQQLKAGYGKNELEQEAREHAGEHRR